MLIICITSYFLQISRFFTNTKRHFCLWRNHTNAQSMKQHSIKPPHNENSKANKINKNQYSLQKLSSTTKEMDALDYFYTDHPFLD